jgi:hypothetical protein
VLVSAADNPFAGSWKLNTAKSVGPAPSCVHDGIMRIRPEIFTGAGNQGPAGEPSGKGKQSAECTSVYLFTPSPDGRTLTLTQPQKNPAFKAVFDKQ